MKNRRARTNPELANFLKTKRESLNPEAFNIPRTGRRRTPGLRREEVATLSGVGLTWYTWLEQGRNIGVSVQFLDNLSKVFQLNCAEREHLYLLAHMRAPLETGHTKCQVPKVIEKIISTLPKNYLCYVLNLHWDILAFNQRADEYFKFSQIDPKARNFLQQLFLNPDYQILLPEWHQDAFSLLSSFRRDYARAQNNAQIQAMITLLLEKSTSFNAMWHQYEIYQPCTGQRVLCHEGRMERYDYTSLTFDSEQHQRLIIYVPKDLEQATD